MRCDSYVLLGKVCESIRWVRYVGGQSGGVMSPKVKESLSESESVGWQSGRLGGSA